MHILVVDDDQVMVELLQYFLEEEGISVTTANSPPEAMNRLQHEAVDLVLSDLVMPDGGGCRLIESIHKVQPLLPVIVMSGYGSQDFNYPREQTQGFWQKGGDINSLISLVKRAI